MVMLTTLKGVPDGTGRFPRLTWGKLVYLEIARKWNCIASSHSSIPTHKNFFQDFMPEYNIHEAVKSLSEHMVEPEIFHTMILSLTTMWHHLCCNSHSWGTLEFCLVLKSILSYF